MGCGWQPAQDKAQLGGPPVNMVRPISLLPTFPTENPSAFLSQGHSTETTNNHFEKQNLTIIHPLHLNRDSLKTPMLRTEPPIPFHKLLNVYSQAFIQVLSDSLSNLILTAACVDVINPIFQMSKLIFSSLHNSPKVTQFLGGKVEFEPRCSDSKFDVLCTTFQLLPGNNDSQPPAPSDTKADKVYSSSAFLNPQPLASGVSKTGER